MFYLKDFRNYIFNFGAFLRNKVIMTHLKLVILVLATITIFACESDPVESIGSKVVGVVWEPAGSFPSDGIVGGITFVNNGNIWLNRYSHSENKTSFYLSTNNGDTWVKKNNTPLYTDAYRTFITVNPVNGYLFAANYGGLYRLTDNSENWENIIDSVDINGIIFEPSGEMYIGYRKLGENIFCYSNDNGNTWVEKSKGLPYFWLTSVGKDGTLYGNSDNGVYHSTDKGTIWLPSSNYNDWFLSLTTCDDGSIFGTVLNVGIVKSTDKGVNWTIVNNTSSFFEVLYNNVTKNIFATSGYDIYRSNNLGEDWKLLNQNQGVANLGVNPKTGQMFAVTAYGVYRTKNYPK